MRNQIKMLADRERHAEILDNVRNSDRLSRSGDTRRGDSHWWSMPWKRRWINRHSRRTDTASSFRGARDFFFDSLTHLSDDPWLRIALQLVAGFFTAVTWFFLAIAHAVAWLFARTIYRRRRERRRARQRAGSEYRLQRDLVDETRRLRIALEAQLEETRGARLAQQQGIIDPDGQTTSLPRVKPRQLIDRRIADPRDPAEQPTSVHRTGWR